VSVTSGPTAWPQFPSIARMCVSQHARAYLASVHIHSYLASLMSVISAYHQATGVVHTAHQQCILVSYSYLRNCACVRCTCPDVQPSLCAISVCVPWCGYICILIHSSFIGIDHYHRSSKAISIHLCIYDGIMIRPRGFKLRASLLLYSNPTLAAKSRPATDCSRLGRRGVHSVAVKG